MKIGILVHSVNGNTLSVCEALKEKLLASGHKVNLERISAIEKEPVQSKDKSKIALKSIPDISQYDIVVLAAPVHGFSISEVMQAYLLRINYMHDLKVACITTQQFPYPWMGGNRAIKQLASICESKGATVVEKGIVNWSSSKRSKMIEDVVEKFNLELF